MTDTLYSTRSEDRTYLERMIAHSETTDVLKFDLTAATADMTFLADDDEMFLSARDRESVAADLFGANAVLRRDLPLTDHALAQACAKLSVPPYGYMKACPAGLRADNMRHWLREVKPSSWFMRGIDDGSGGVWRGVLSNNYSPVSNTAILRAVEASLASVEAFRVVRPYVSADALHVRVLVADTTDGNYGVGAYVRNGEIGNYGIMVAPIVQRHACTNSIILAGESWRQRHYRVSDAYVRAGLAEKLGFAFGMAVEAIDKIVAAEAIDIPNLGAVVNRLVDRYNLKKTTTRDAILAGTERQSTAMGLVNGLSYAAHADATLSIDEAVRLESLAGAILAKPDDLFGAMLAISRVLIGEQREENAEVMLQRPLFGGDE